MPFKVCKSKDIVEVVEILKILRYKLSERSICHLVLIVERIELLRKNEKIAQNDLFYRLVGVLRDRRAY